jgi:CMP-N,N'-diacetyllegionaminic acid synthase
MPECRLIDRMFCAVPARGGSKRLPRKNIRELARKPLIAHTILAAMQTGLFSSVYVCTDDEEIAQIAEKFGACVEELMPSDLCGDLVASHVPCRYMLRKIAEHQHSDFDSLICLQPTSPLRSAEDISAAVDVYERASLDFVVSVTPLDPHDFHWAVIPATNDTWKMYFDNQYMKERPQLPPVYRPNGSIKIAKLAALDETGHFFGSRLGVVETPAERSVHVATEFDFRFCEYLLAGTAQ